MDYYYLSRHIKCDMGRKEGGENFSKFQVPAKPGLLITQHYTEILIKNHNYFVFIVWPCIVEVSCV